MYKLLIADDERIIREGLRNMRGWSALGVQVCDLAANGAEAWEKIKEHRPDFVIIDIKMPIMSGLQVIERANEAGLSCLFIILSGYGEFEFAKIAMAYGVKHFLLKPCNNENILAAAKEIIAVIEERKRDEEIVEKARTRFQQLLPFATEQFIRDYLTGQIHTRQEIKADVARLGLRDEPASIGLLHIPSHDLEHVSVLKSIAAQRLGKDRVRNSLSIGNNLLFLLEPLSYVALFEWVRELRDSARRHLGTDVRFAVSEAVCFDQWPEEYQRLKDCLLYSGKLAEGVAVTPDDVPPSGFPLSAPRDCEKILDAMKAGDQISVQQLIMELQSGDAEAVRSRLMQLFACLLSGLDPSENIRYIQLLTEAEAKGRLAEFVEGCALAVIRRDAARSQGHYGRLMRQVLEYTQKYISDERLSLTWLAHKFLYVNVDYLGRVIKHETGQKYSTYLFEQRMERALEVIAGSQNIRIIDVASAVGFGSNAQYFSQQFKKYTGLTPSEYIKDQR